MTLQEENERLRELLREAIHCCPDEQLRNEMKALSQQAEPDHVEDMLAMVEPAPAQDEREAFEAEARKLLYVLDREAISGEYIVPDTENAWQLWRARDTRPAQTEQQPEPEALIKVLAEQHTLIERQAEVVGALLAP